MYKPLEINLMEISGAWPAMVAMRRPKGGVPFSAPVLTQDPCDIGIDLHAEDANLAEYRIGADSLSTSSAMHGELKGMTGKALAEKKQADLPDKIYHRIEKFNYQSLRGMYLARRYHRHPDWHVFCDFVETLPYFDKLIVPPRPVRNGWQPIETAPKAESNILTCDQFGNCSVRYWGEGDDGEFAWQPRIRGNFPKYWMPLPTPPEKP